jgi:hypothetical protein
MSISPLARADALRIGTVDFVSPDEIKVLLELDAPDVVALNTGSPRPFPRVNGYVLIPSDGGHLVGQVEFITVERSPYPKRKGMQDFGLIDLPYPLRKLSLNPLGVLRSEADDAGAIRLRFRRGVDGYPTVGQPVLLPTTEQLTSIVESGDDRRVWVGTSPLAADAKVCVDPDRLFGRHVAVLGNTGSGKSCSVAGLIRWSLEAAHNACAMGGPNARFVVLDPNGEYACAFDNLDRSVEVRRFAVDPGDGVGQLHVPLWFWNSEEWCAFTQAAPKMQRPLLKRAIREVRSNTHATVREDVEHETARLRRYLVSRAVMLRTLISSGEIASEATKFGRLLEATRGDLEAARHRVPKSDLDSLIESISVALQRRFESFTKNGKTVEYYTSFHEADTEPVINEIAAQIEVMGGWLPHDGPGEDVPIPFIGTELADHLEVLAAEQNASQYIESLTTRIRAMLADPRMSCIVSPASEISLNNWLNAYVGDDANEKASVTIIDLSLVPGEVVHVVTAVIARMILEAQQRYRKLNKGKVLPTVLVMEEAHTFVKRYKDDVENQNTAAICCQVFEKIAREGRKFGLGLVLSSQRPSELSPTVLSQCNTFLLHRISNDRDQELVHKLIPDNLRGLLRDLPSLPARQAVLLGWASELPTLVEMRYLSHDHRPMSADPDFWAVWTRVSPRPLAWEDVARDWQQYGIVSTPDQADFGEAP